MKNAAAYEKKIKKLLKDVKKQPASDTPSGEEALGVFIESILQADCTKKQASDGLVAIKKEFVDFNELRVSPPKDIGDCLGKDYPDARAKATMMTTVLLNIFQCTYNVSIDYMSQMTKRDLRRHLGELGLSPYASSCVVLLVFGGHAIPVDQTLVEVLKMGQYVHPDSDGSEVQGFLERVIPQKDDPSVHEFFRTYIAKFVKVLNKKRQDEARAKEQAEARAQKQAEARAQKQAEARAKKQEEALAKSVKKPKKKKVTKKVTKKPPAKVVKAHKKPVKKVVKSTRKKATPRKGK